jgi:hypothetical protein
VERQSCFLAAWRIFALHLAGYSFNCLVDLWLFPEIVATKRSEIVIQFVH